MTERTFQLLKDALIAVPTVTFTGFVAWWSWRRDQERLRVQKILGEDIGVSVTNLSLFPVRVCGAGFQLPDGRKIPLKDARRERTDKGPLTLPELSSGSDGPRVAWPVDIPSYGRSVFYASLSDERAILEATLPTLPEDPKIKVYAEMQAGTIKYSRGSLKSRVHMHFRKAGRADQQKGKL